MIGLKTSFVNAFLPHEKFFPSALQLSQAGAEAETIYSSLEKKYLLLEGFAYLSFGKT